MLHCYPSCCTTMQKLLILSARHSLDSFCHEAFSIQLQQAPTPCLLLGGAFVFNAEAKAQSLTVLYLHVQHWLATACPFVHLSQTCTINAARRWLRFPYRASTRRWPCHRDQPAATAPTVQIRASDVPIWYWLASVIGKIGTNSDEDSC